MVYDKLKGKMREKRLTQNDLACKLGISVQSLNAKLNGRTNFTILEVENITKYLELKDVEEYFFNSKIPNMQQNNCS